MHERCASLPISLCPVFKPTETCVIISKYFRGIHVSNIFLFADVRALDALGLEPYNVEICRILRDYKIEVKTKTKTTVFIKLVHTICIDKVDLDYRVIVTLYIHII